ncbi:hypothetical protein CDD83_7240 [Cordyceps sp. RAO-2017]|nr:hypothetical protein CDD83_7240 [Cordyceps sp. RAO-2017]
MKATAVILASLLGGALAAPPRGNPQQKGVDKTPPPNDSDKDVCFAAYQKLKEQCLESAQRDEPAAERCEQEGQEARKQCLDVQVKDGKVVAGDEVRKEENEARRKEICSAAYQKLMDACLAKPQDDTEPATERLERCRRDNEKARSQCLDVQVKDEEVVTGDEARQKDEEARQKDEEARRKDEEARREGKENREKEAKCAVEGNRARAECMKGRFTSKANTGKTRENCDEEKKKKVEACMRVGPIDQYCDDMAAASNKLYDKNFCLKAFRLCGDPTSLKDEEAKKCADQKMADKKAGTADQQDSTPIDNEAVSDQVASAQGAGGGCKAIVAQAEECKRTNGVLR